VLAGVPQASLASFVLHHVLPRFDAHVHDGELSPALQTLLEHAASRAQLALLDDAAFRAWLAPLSVTISDSRYRAVVLRRLSDWYRAHSSISRPCS